LGPKAPESKRGIRGKPDRRAAEYRIIRFRR
jgi:hypothetical protein